MPEEGHHEFTGKEPDRMLTLKGYHELIELIKGTALGRALQTMNLETDRRGFLLRATIGNILSITELWLEQTEQAYPALYQKYRTFYSAIQRFKPKT